MKILKSWSALVPSCVQTDSGTKAISSFICDFHVMTEDVAQAKIFLGRTNTRSWCVAEKKTTLLSHKFCIFLNLNRTEYFPVS
jgi:hypothetical protein